MVREFLVSVCILVGEQGALGADYYEVTKQEIDRLWRDASKEEFVWESHYFSKVHSKGVSYWLVKPTLKGVYPAVWKRWLEEDRKGVHVRMEGWYAGDENAFLEFFGADLSAGDQPVKKVHNREH